MKLISTNGKEFYVDLRPSKWPRRSKEDCKSELQWNVSQHIWTTYPNDPILEEFFIPGDSLYIDFFLPRRKCCVEVHGQQHFTYSAYFHGSHKKFKDHQARDARKKLWCEINKLRLVEIKFDDNDDLIKLKVNGL